MIYRVVWLICRALFRLLCQRRIIGAHHVPAEGPVILASNHLSNLDPPAVGTGVWRPCAYMAKEELFRSRPVAAFISRLNAFPVRRGEGDRAALKHALDLLRSGTALVMFPEGTRSETGDLGKPELGVGMIAYRSGAPVVPVYISGTDRVMPRSGRLRPGRITVTYGEPIRFEAPEGVRVGRDAYENAARHIMAAIADLRDAGTGAGAREKERG